MENFLEKAQLEIAKTIGEPIDPNLPVPPILLEIADFETAEAGEDVKIYTSEDVNGGDLSSTTGDVLYSVASNGQITGVEVTPNTPATLAFTTVQSRLERVHIDNLLNSPDQTVLARRKAAITRGMDKKIVKEALDLILNCDGSSGRPDQEVIQASGMDLYDLCQAMVHKIEDFGDNYILLVGSTVKEALDSYDKVNASNFAYRVGIKEYLAGAGITVVKVNGFVVYGYGSTTAVKVLAATKMILVARDSLVAKGKPITYVRRKINAALAAQMGTEVDATFRATSVIPIPIGEGSYNILAFGIHAFEQRICALLNFRAVTWATYTP